MTKIITDTTSGLPLDLAKQLGIYMIPQLVIFGEQTFRDDVEITTLEFLQKLKASSTVPKTAAPLHTMYFPYFSEAAQTGETVIVIAPTGKMSGTIRSVETAKQFFPNADIRIIDTFTIAGCLASLALIANAMSKEGKTADEIEDAVKTIVPLSHTYFVVDTLEYLQKGGRIGTARALLGELLQVKPILQIKNGQAAPLEQERTKKRALARLIDLTCEKTVGVKNPHLCVMHADAEQEAEYLREQLTTRLNISQIPIYVLPPAIIVHAGPKALATGFFA